MKKNDCCFFYGLLVITLLLAGLSLELNAQSPKVIPGATKNDSVNAWMAYCDSLRLNPNNSKDNFIVLGRIATEGGTIVSANDFENQSKFFSYRALGYYYQQKFDSAQFFFYQSLEAAQRGHLTKQITRACVALIPVNFQLQQAAKVEACKDILQSIADTTKNTGLLKDIDYALGSYYQQKSYYSTAQDYFIKSIELREKEVDTTKDVKAKFDYAIQCDMLSKLYLNTQMVDKSLLALRKAARFAGVSPNVGNRLLSSFVEAFTTAGNIDSALYYNGLLEKQAAGSPVFPSEIVSSSLNIGIYYMAHKQYTKAFPYITRGDTIAARIGSPLLIFQSQMIKGRWLAETGSYDHAIPLLLQSLPVAKQFSRELYSNVLKLLAIAQMGKDKATVALQYYEQYADQADSLAKEKLSVNFADQETRYETSQKLQHIASLDKENRLNMLELQSAGRTRWLLVAGLAAFGVISLLLWLIYRNKEKANRVLNIQNDELEKLNRELVVANDTKAKLFGIIGHDLRSPASHIVQLLQLQKLQPGLLTAQRREQYEQELKTASENVLGTMEDLLLWSKSQLQHFVPDNRKTAIAEVVQKEIQFLQQPAAEKNIRIENNTSPGFLPVTDDNFVSVIVRNLLQNAIRYSEPGSIVAVTNEPDQLRITNPVAMAGAATLNATLQNKQPSPKTSGFGLQIAGDLAGAIGAHLSFVQEDQHSLTAILRWNSTTAFA